MPGSWFLAPIAAEILFCLFDKNKKKKKDSSGKRDGTEIEADAICFLNSFLI
jgi:hypothetical protein